MVIFCLNQTSVLLICLKYLQTVPGRATQTVTGSFHYILNGLNTDKRQYDNPLSPHPGFPQKKKKSEPANIRVFTGPTWKAKYIQAVKLLL